MRDALAATGRPIVYSICEWGQNRPVGRGRADVGNLWRTTGDISDNWSEHDRHRPAATGRWPPYAGPGALERPGHARGRQRRDDRHRVPHPLQPLGGDGRAAADRLRPAQATPQATFDILDEHRRHRGRPGPARQAGPRAVQQRRPLGLRQAAGERRRRRRPVQRDRAAAPISTTAAAVGLPAARGLRAARPVVARDHRDRGHDRRERARARHGDVPRHAPTRTGATTRRRRASPSATAERRGRATPTPCPDGRSGSTARCRTTAPRRRPRRDAEAQRPTSFEGITSEAEAGHFERRGADCVLQRVLRRPEGALHRQRRRATGCG